MLGKENLQATFSREEDIRKELSALFSSMMETLYKVEGSQFRIEILEKPKIQEFINAHASVLDSSFKQVKMSEGMRRRLERSNYIFSGMKTFHELNEAFPSLLDENGNRKPFEQFLNDVRSVDSTYNENYLKAEYNFVQASAQMAAKWEGFMQDGDRYNLQYRTAGDDKVRPEHAALDRVTLPITDPFWEEYYPPNGWNCRCTVVQVRKTKYPTTPHKEAMALGEEATGKDTKGIFRFNAGQEQKTVPDYNPYTIKRCKDCDIAKGKQKLVFIPDNELCAACKLIHSMSKDKDEGTNYRSKIKVAQKRLVQHYRQILPEVKLGKFVSKRLNVQTLDGINIVINKKFYEETINKYKNDILYPIKLEYTHNAHELITKATIINPSEESKDHPDAIFRVYEFTDDCYRVEMKVRCNSDGNYLHILRVYKK